MVLNGQISGIELPAIDVHRAAKFYADTFGWKFEAPSSEKIPSSKMQTFTAPGDIFPDEGVVSKVDEIAQSGGAKFYINVDDMKAAIEAVVKNGGKQISDIISLGPHIPPFQFSRGEQECHLHSSWTIEIHSVSAYFSPKTIFGQKGS